MRWGMAPLIRNDCHRSTFVVNGNFVKIAVTSVQKKEELPRCTYLIEGGVTEVHLPMDFGFFAK
jgi:hypothetical protein